MARRHVDLSKREQPMSAEERRRLIESPISINTYGSAGKSHGGCDIRASRRPQPTDDGYMESHITAQDIAILFQQRAVSRKRGRTQ